MQGCIYCMQCMFRKIWDINIVGSGAILVNIDMSVGPPGSLEIHNFTLIFREKVNLNYIDGLHLTLYACKNVGDPNL